MDNNQAEKAPIAASKSFMAVGPTLHYSHKNVQRCWLLAVCAFALSCLFWSKILSGSFWSFNFEVFGSPQFWHLGRLVKSGLSILEYPWYILVLGLLMGILAIVPVLISQLMCFSYSIPFILLLVFLANLPGFAIFVLVSCIAAACRPLRFRSRFIAIVLCTAPQLVFWGFFGGAGGVEAVRWGFSYMPWICAWLVSLAIAGAVLGIGHFTRYRPGLVWIVTMQVLLTAIGVFEFKVSFDELDYQLYVANNNPEQMEEFNDQNITQMLDETLTDPTVKRYLAGFFYPTDPIQLRAELKREIQIQMGHNRWPGWFSVPKRLEYQTKRQQLFEQYDFFIRRRPKSRRMPIALYFKAVLSEYSPDIKVLGQKEVLHFYSDYPFERSRDVWYRLYEDFGGRAESIEARWRIAKHWAGQGRFEQAQGLLEQGQVMIRRLLEQLEKALVPNDTFFSSFQPPADSVITGFKLSELQRKLNHLRVLIGAENRAGGAEAEKRLARFVMLNPHVREFKSQLDDLLGQIGDKDPLRDNILLAEVKLIADEQLRAEKLDQLHREFQKSDGGMEALYELGLLRIRFWRQHDESNVEQKRKYLAQARATLESFISLYPESFCAEQVNKNLNDLPAVD